jgi:hypothetical protein
MVDRLNLLCRQAQRGTKTSLDIFRFIVGYDGISHFRLAKCICQIMLTIQKYSLGDQMSWHQVTGPIQRKHPSVMVMASHIIKFTTNIQALTDRRSVPEAQSAPATLSCTALHYSIYPRATCSPPIVNREKS